jgi:hypothetical protein
MDTTKARAVPAPLERLQRRFERWRQTRKIPSPIPKPLWAAAARMAGRYGISRTAQMLCINYSALKNRVEEGTAAARGSTTVTGTRAEASALARFVELASPVPVGACECIFELERGDGAKMRVQLKGIAIPDLAALSQSFWNHQR